MGSDTKLHKRKRIRSDRRDEIKEGLENEMDEMNRRLIYEKLYDLEYHKLISKHLYFKIQEEGDVEKLLLIKRNNNQKNTATKKENKIYKTYIDMQTRDEISTVREMALVLRSKHIYHPFSIHDTRFYLEQFLKK